MVTNPELIAELLQITLRGIPYEHAICLQGMGRRKITALFYYSKTPEGERWLKRAIAKWYILMFFLAHHSVRTNLFRSWWHRTWKKKEGE